jgi:hypothetical protein
MTMRSSGALRYEPTRKKSSSAPLGPLPAAHRCPADPILELHEPTARLTNTTEKPEQKLSIHDPAPRSESAIVATSTGRYTAIVREIGGTGVASSKRTIRPGGARTTGQHQHPWLVDSGHVMTGSHYCSAGRTLMRCGQSAQPDGADAERLVIRPSNCTTARRHDEQR